VSKVVEGALLQPNHDECVAAETLSNAAEMGEVCMRSKKSGSESSKSAAISQQAEKSHDSFGLTALTSCLVDADGNNSAGAGRARRKALGASALIQFCTLMALLIVPLFATGSRLILRPTNFVPLPPYGGAPKSRPSDIARPSSPAHHDLHPRFAYTPPQAPIGRPINTHQSMNDDLPSGANLPGPVFGLQGTGNGADGPPNILDGMGEKSGPPVPLPEPKMPPSPRKPVVVSQGVQLALLTHRVEPTYPNFAKQTHREGTVELRAIISIDGTVRDLQVLSGDPVLAKAAQDAVAQWRFRPTLLNGSAVEVITFVTVKFHIDH
jgi:TonB family protein